VEVVSTVAAEVSTAVASVEGVSAGALAAGVSVGALVAAVSVAALLVGALVAVASGAAFMVLGLVSASASVLDTATTIMATTRAMRGRRMATGGFADFGGSLRLTSVLE
jgi:hypothetical protein